MSSLRFYAGLFLVTACTLMMQLIQTRILSVVAWYHLAFFAISMAMFGLTAGAIWVYLRGSRFTTKTLSVDLSYFSALYALSIVLFFAVQMTLAPLAPGMETTVAVVWTWIEVSVCMAVPFFFSGVAVSLALTRSPFPIGRVYGVDLIGAAAGCLGVLWLLNNTDAPSTVFWVAAVAAAGAWLFAGSGVGDASDAHLPGARFVRRPLLLAVLFAVAGLLNGNTSRGLQPLVVKDRVETRSMFMFKEWNSFSRISVADIGVKSAALWGPSVTLPPNTRARMRFMNIDGNAGTAAFYFDGDFKPLDFLRYDITNIAYYLPNRKTGAVIGVGGGRDVLSAAMFGVQDITAVEINPIFVRLLLDEPGYREFTGFDNLQNVRIEVDEGRSWFARTDQSFDIVQMSLIDTWAATGAGAFTLSENGLYTVEAWKVFLNRLNPGGVYTVSRWYNANNIDETGRMLSLATAALMELGITKPAQHIFLASQGTVATLVLSRSPLTDQDLDALHGVTDKMQFEVLLSPAQDPTRRPATLNAIVNAKDRAELDAITGALELDLTPPVDDRPFFFNQLPLNKPIEALRLIRSSALAYTDAGVLRGNLYATLTLFILFGLASLLVILTIVWPLRRALADAGRDVVIGGTAYFLLIGMGFMFVEIALLQRTSVVLGHPIYSLSVLLFSLILSAGIGSLMSETWQLNTRSRFTVWAVLTAAYLASLPVWTPALFAEFAAGSLLIRSAVCVAVLAPAGILMGFGFPTGMHIISRLDSRPTPWFWGINGAAGVLASIIALANNIANGIGSSLLVAAVCYLLLVPAVLLFLMKRDPLAT